MTHLAIAEPSWPTVYAVLDKLERQPREISAEKLAAAGLSAANVEVVLGFDTLDFATLQKLYGESSQVAPHAARFTEYFAHCESLGIAEWIRFDLTIVRGLAYYTGIVFELFDAVGEFRAICGGGRYDNLLSSLGGVDLPALGFGMGDVVLGELLRERGKMPVFQATEDRYFVVGDEGTKASTVLKVASGLRRQLRNSSFSYGLNRSAIEERKASRQIDDARANGANFTLRITNKESAVAMELATVDGKRRVIVPAHLAATLAATTATDFEVRNAAEHMHDMARALLNDQPQAQHDG